MLRKIRIFSAAFFFVCITALFLDFTGTLHVWLGWMVKAQFVPAILSLNIAVLVSLVVLTLLFGRVYCSVICPLGVMQDIISNLSGRRKGKKLRFSFVKEHRLLRIAVLLLFAVALVAGFTWLAALVEPYSVYGRIVNTLVSPFYLWGNNLLAYIAERADSYAFYSVDVWMRSGIAVAISAVTLALIATLAWRGGRTWCNTVCPVGTLLGVLSRYSLFRLVIDTSKCNGCKVCERSCKSSCIDIATHTVDYSRCVICMNCVDKCKRGAFTYKFVGLGRDNKSVTSEAADGSRRSFLTIAAGFAASSLMAQKGKKVDGGLAAIEDKRVPRRAVPVVPTGAISLRNFSQHCTSCQLCVSKCPNDVLRPSQSIDRLMQPQMSFERGFCRPACNICSQVCPTGAIKPIAREMKSAIKVGTAVWVAQNCIASRDGVSCGNCARHCPNGAITMIDCKEKPGVKIPMVDAERCVGCGACEYVCPARPFSAIFVEGIEEHRTV